ncbi:hypothetical protein AWH56_002125 [Anaerobacillus isosaccharinicus]|uniref:Uncharacterized protein n=1 Tax=Anaerobacillus isosaccharinicus TaxID=1532552 RepID=A0A7S7L8Y1_9BACI|nr:hypothetical protein [Anaerobacillus isosaccharinicus]MBA5585153.1 hypothetical protein [Anaerobacillus isosaccharinicus]QOY36506.1 hypothetical protein AWH56_002125 [Anaerobacillus isosaccharinicus]
MAIIGVIFVVLLRFYFFTSICVYTKMIDKIVYIYITVGASLFAIVLASLAVMTALTNGKLIGLLLKEKTLHDLLFPFWFVASSWGTTILVGLVLYILVQNIEYFIIPIDFLFPISTFLFIFSLVASVSLTGHTIRIITEVAKYFEE